MSKAIPARLKFPTPVSRLDHLQKWLAAIGSKITVRWHKHSCDLYVFEGGHRNHKSNFDEARIFLSGVDEGRRDYAEQNARLVSDLETAKRALEFYAENGRLCRLIHSGGDAGRNALAEDGGKIAQAALKSE
jgi:hypothetical protein